MWFVERVRAWSRVTYHAYYRVTIKLRISRVYPQRVRAARDSGRRIKIVALFFPIRTSLSLLLHTELFIHLGTDWHTPTDDRKVAWEIKTTCQPVSLASVLILPCPPALQRHVRCTECPGPDTHAISHADSGAYLKWIVPS